MSIYNTIKMYAIAGLAILSMGCSEKRTEISDVIEEEAKVTNMHHSPSRTVPYSTGKAAGVRYHPEENWVTFDGEVDFTVNNRDIFGRFKKGDTAVVRYRNRWKVTLDDTDGDGKKEVVSREQASPEFVDAIPR